MFKYVLKCYLSSLCMQKVKCSLYGSHCYKFSIRTHHHTTWLRVEGGNQLTEQKKKLTYKKFWINNLCT